VKDNLTDLEKAHQARRKKMDWTMESIEQKAREEAAAYEKLAKNEPDAIASGGDMANILEDKNNEDE